MTLERVVEIEKTKTIRTTDTTMTEIGTMTDKIDTKRIMTEIIHHDPKAGTDTMIDQEIDIQVIEERIIHKVETEITQTQITIWNSSAQRMYGKLSKMSCVGVNFVWNVLELWDLNNKRLKNTHI